MNEALLVVVLAGVAGVIALQISVLRRRAQIDTAPLDGRLQSVENSVERVERSVRDEVARNREESSAAARLSREEVQAQLKSYGDSMQQGLAGMTEIQRGQIAAMSEQVARLTEANQTRFDNLKNAVEQRLSAIQEDNAKKLEQMRATVEEKLQGAIEKRLGESFKVVSERLEAVHKGLGEMQSLAAGVGDLKKVLSNVKTRGTFGEVQLGAMLEQVLSPGQYETNVSTKGGRERVEFAIRLPGRGNGEGEVWLPIDAKFPVEDYNRLLDAQDRACTEDAETAIKQLEQRVKGCAKEISEKYIEPPRTTDFGILYLPTEGLFAEVVRRAGLTEFLQRQHHVVIAGPTTLWALLNSLQMGFKTLAIERRSKEVWDLLSAVKTEWARYGDALDKIRGKLDEAAKTVTVAANASKKISRRLEEVQSLPSAESETTPGAGDVPIPPKSTE